MGLRESEFDQIVNLLGREPTLTELGMFSVMWSEHCGYKYSRPVLASFAKYKEAMEGEGLENAGIVDLGDGLGVVMKIESHNHPSAVEPYQGAATGVGGIIRDIFTMGARPIASLNSLRFGPIQEGKADHETVKHNQFLLDGVVRGIAGYGNCVGVPTVAGEVSFHPRFNGRPLVNAMCIGLVEIDKIATAGAGGEGNPVIYLGSATGKDGIHGATFASEDLEEENQDKRPNVQIGDPFAEKQLIEATLEALQTGAVQSIQDMGAAGLTCSTIEMSAKGKVGMEINLDLVPMRESDMSGYELMLSESQERMLCVAHKGREQEVIDVFHKWGVHAVVIGEVTDSGKVRVSRHGEVIAEVTATHLADDCPTYSTEPVEPEYFGKAQQFDPQSIPIVGFAAGLQKLAQSPNLASKRWVFGQYDQQVQTQTTLLPGEGDAAVLAPRGTKKGIAVKVDGNGRWVYFDPAVGGQLAVAEAARNVACTGARPVAVTDGLNYGNPELPHVFWQFDQSVRAIARACEIMQTPVISGNVSFYNQGDLGEVLPSPLIGMLGVLEDASNRIGYKVNQVGSQLYLINYPLDMRQDGLGASSYLAEIHGIEDGLPVAPDMAMERVLCHFLADSVERGYLLAAHDVSEGGLAFCLAEMLAGSGCGADIQLPTEPLQNLTHPDAPYFGEFPGWVVVNLQEGREDEFLANLPDGLNSFRLGMVKKSSILTIQSDRGEEGSVDLSEFIRWHESCIPDLLQS